MNPHRTNVAAITGRSTVEAIIGRLSLLLFLLLLSPHPTHSTPTAPLDLNLNGMSDVWERHYNQGELFNPATPDHHPEADPDGDGWTNRQESIAGTDPFTGKPPEGLVVCHVTHLANQEEAPTPEFPDGRLIDLAILSWDSLPGKQYTLLFSADLEAESWTAVDTPHTGDGAPIAVPVLLTDTEGRSPDRLFWRVQINDLDSDDDGLTDHEEIMLGSNPYSADTSGDGIPDGWLAIHGFDPAADHTSILFPGYEITALAAYQGGVQARPDATPDDLDGDGLSNNLDAVPDDPEINWQRTPETRYVWIEQVNKTGATAVSKHGHILFPSTNSGSSNLSNLQVLWDSNTSAWVNLIGASSWSGSGFESGNTPDVFDAEWMHIDDMNDDGMVIGRSDMIGPYHPVSWVLASAIMKWQKTGTASDQYADPIYIVPGFEYVDPWNDLEKVLVDNVNNVPRIANDGTVTAVSYFVEAGNLPVKTEWVASDAHVANHSNQMTAWALFDMDWDIDYYAGAVIGATGGLLVEHHPHIPKTILHYRNGANVESLEGLLANTDHGITDTDISKIPATSESPESRIWFSVNQSNGDSVFIEKRTGGSGVSRWHQPPSMAEGAIRVNARGEAITATKLWRNGQYTDLNELATKPETVTITQAIDLASNGLILVTADDDGVTKTGLLLPFEELSPGMDYSESGDGDAEVIDFPAARVSNPVPRIQIDQGTVTVNESAGTITVSIPGGKVYDPVADNLPADEGVIASITMSEEESAEETTAVVTTHRDEDTATFWKQHPYEGRFGQMTLTLPLVEGDQSVALATSPNAVGNVGKATLHVRTDKGVLWGGSPGITSEVVFNLVLPGTFSESEPNEIIFYRGDRTPLSTDPVLAEEAAGARTFIGPYQDGELTVSLIDFDTPTEGLDGFTAEFAFTSGDGIEWIDVMSFEETAPQSLRFTATISLPGGGTGPVTSAWFASISAADPVSVGTYNPFTIRIAPFGPNPEDYAVRFGAEDNAQHEVTFEELDGRWVLRGGSVNFVFITNVFGEDGEITGRRLWVRDRDGQFQHLTLPPDGPVTYELVSNAEGAAQAIRLLRRDLPILSVSVNNLQPYLAQAVGGLRPDVLNLRNIAWIEPHAGPDNSPAMPGLLARLEGPAEALEGLEVRWRLQCEYRRPRNGGGVHPLGHAETSGNWVTGAEDFVTIPLVADNVRNQAIGHLYAGRAVEAQRVLDQDAGAWTEWTAIDPDQPWNINTWIPGDADQSAMANELAQRGLFGGLARVYYQVRRGDRVVNADPFLFMIGGRNPDDAICRAYIDSFRPGGANAFAMTFPAINAGNPIVHDFWYAYAIAKHESKSKSVASNNLLNNALAGEADRLYGTAAERLYYNQFWEGRVDRLPNKYRSSPGMPLWNDDSVTGGTGGFGIFQLTFGTFEQIVETYTESRDGNAFNAAHRLPGDRFANGILQINPMPRRWKWDWKENTNAFHRVGIAKKYQQATNGPSCIREFRKKSIAAEKSFVIPRHSVPYMPRENSSWIYHDRGPQRGGISHRLEPYVGEATQRYVRDISGNGSTDDEQGNLPVNQARIIFYEVASPDEGLLYMGPDYSGTTRTTTPEGYGSMLDLDLIRRYNGGEYIRLPNVQSGWRFDRLTGRYLPQPENITVGFSYVDAVAREIEDIDIRIGPNP